MELISLRYEIVNFVLETKMFAESQNIQPQVTFDVVTFSRIV